MRSRPRTLYPRLVLAITLIATALGAWLLATTERERDRARFDAQATTLTDRLERRLAAYVAMLRATRGLFETGQLVTPEQFQRFAANLELETQYPGVQGLGFARQASTTDVPTVVKHLHDEGLREFHAWPDEPGATERSLITQLAPLDARNRHALGYDMHSDPQRGEAMDRARDSGLPAATGPVTLVQEIAPPVQRGFLILVPVYRGGGVPATVSERRQALVGFVYCAFRTGDLVEALFAHEPFALRIWHGPEPSPETMLYSAPQPRRPRFVTRRPVIVAGQTWTVEIAALPTFALGSARLVLWFTAVALAVSLLLFLASAAQLRARRSAEEAQAAADRERRRRAFIADATALLASSLDFQATLRSVCTLIVPEWGDWAMVHLTSADGAHLAELACPDEQRRERLVRLLDRFHPERQPSSFIYRAAIEGRPTMSRNLAPEVVKQIWNDQAIVDAVQGLGVRSMICVPLRLRQEVFGAVTVARARADGYSDEDLAFIGELADRAAVAIENARLYRDAGEASALVDTLLSSAPVGLAFLDPALRVVQVNRYLKDLALPASTDWVGRRLEEVVPPSLRGIEADLERVLATRQPLLGRELTDETPGAPRRWFVASFYPVIDRDGALLGVGVVLAEMTDRKLLEVELRRGARHAGLRADVSMALADATSLDEVLQRSTQAIVKHLDAAFARIWLLEGDTLVLKASAGRYMHFDGDHARVKVGTLKIGRIAAERQPHLTNDVQHDTGISDADWAKREGMQAFAGYPLLVGGRAIGVVALFSRHPLDTDTLASLGSLAEALAEGVERRRTAQALVATNAQLEVVLRGVGEGITAQTSFGQVVYANDAAARLLGVDDGRQLLGDGLMQVLRDFEVRNEDGGPFLMERMPGRSAIASRSTVERILRVRHRQSGDERWIIVTAAPVLDERNEPRMVISVFRDFTDRRRAEESEQLLSQATALLASSLEHHDTLEQLCRLLVPRHADWCAVDLVSDEGRLERVAAAHVDRTKEPLLAELHRAVGAPATRMQEEVARTGRSTLIAEIVPSMITANPQLSPEHRRALTELGLRSVMVVPLTVSGKVTGTITMVVAQSARRYDEQDRRFAEELGRRAALALENARLYRETREAVRLRDVFLSIASHELKTPLTSLMLQAQALLRATRGQTALPVERTVRRVEMIESNVQRLATLVNQLLDVSRIAAGRLEMQPERFSLSELAADVVARFDDVATRAGCQLRLETEGDVVGQWDRLRLDQVLTNLVSNAIKYGAGQPVEITVGRRGTQAILSVRDHGIGIAAEHQGRIFERFERLVSERHYGGFGLGLWIARQNVEALGGTIRVESQPGQGSTFIVELPLELPAGMGTGAAATPHV